VQTLGISARWRNTIADWVHDKTGLGVSRQITFCVEGNIGAGKTTWLDMVRSDTGAEHELIEVVPEPVHQWQKSPQGHNMLDLFYKDPKKYAFAFQQFVLVTRMQQVWLYPSTAPLVLLCCLNRSVCWSTD
jgi:ABC-type cobalamin/Fe3+-siderophores transport system ATPase subunit